MCSACNKSTLIDTSQYENQELDPNRNVIFLYSIPDQKLGIYNKDTYVWTPIYDEDNLFQYVFDNDSFYVVSGHSVDNGFVLLKVGEDRKSISRIFDLYNDSDCFFPLARDDENFYYVLYENEKDKENIKRSIFTFDKDNKMQIVLSTKRLITSGIIINGVMYFTVYEPDKNSYSAYALTLKSPEKEIHIVQSNLETRDLFNVNGELYFSSKDKIFNENQTFDKKYENFFVKNLLIQMYSNKNNDMICTIMDINTREIVNEFKYPVNFEVNGDSLYIYCKGNIYKLQLGE